MNIFVYSDESGVLDKAHNDIFAFGGLVFLSKDEKDIASRKYHAAERIVRNSGDYGNVEIKASTIIAKEKRDRKTVSLLIAHAIFRSLFNGKGSPLF